MSWLDKFFAAYSTVAIAGSALPQRPTLNFVSGVTGADNPSLNRTDLTVSGGGGGGGFTAITAVDVQATTASTAYVGSISGFGAAGGTIPINATSLQFAAGQTSAGIGQATAGATQTPANFVITPQAPNGSASTGHQTPGSLVVALASPVGTGSHAVLAVTEGGSNVAQLGQFLWTFGSVPAWGLWFGPVAATIHNVNFLQVSGGGSGMYDPNGVFMSSNHADFSVASSTVIADPIEGILLYSQNAVSNSAPGPNLNLRDNFAVLATLEASATIPLMGIGEFSTSRRYTFLNQITGSLHGPVSANIPSGDGVTWFGVAQSNPISAPSGGFLLYSDQTTGAAFIWNPGTGSPFQIGGGGGGGTVTGVDVAGADNAHIYVQSISGASGGGGLVPVGVFANPVALKFPSALGQVVLYLGSQSVLLNDGSNNPQLNGAGSVQVQVAGTPLALFSGAGLLPDSSLSSFTLGWNSGTTVAATGANLILQPQFSTNATPTGGSVLFELQHSSTADAFVKLNYAGAYTGVYTTKTALGLVPGSSGLAAGIWGPAGSSPTNANFAISMTTTSTAINGPTSGGEVDIAVNDVDVATFKSATISFAQPIGGLNTALAYQVATQAASVGGTVVLSNAQYSCPEIQLTGTLSGGDLTLQFPTTIGASWILDCSNIVFSGHAVWIKTASSSSVQITSGTNAMFHIAIGADNGPHWVKLA